MFEPGYYVTAELRLKDVSKLQTVRQALAELAEWTLTEPGCTIFVVHHDATTPTRFVLWERFDDEAAFKRHLAGAHTQEFAALDLVEVAQYYVTDTVR
ncbi:MAG: putative quinol monooxygenase [Burkholderiaceae bacterium]